MEIAIIGSRSLSNIDIEKHLPDDTSLIISGGAKGVDTLAECYADKSGIPKMIILPEYKKYGVRAPLVRNKLIVDNADRVIAFWNGASKGTKYVIDYAKRQGKLLTVVLIRQYYMF